MPTSSDQAFTLESDCSASGTIEPKGTNVISGSLVSGSKTYEILSVVLEAASMV